MPEITPVDATELGTDMDVDATVVMTAPTAKETVSAEQRLEMIEAAAKKLGGTHALIESKRSGVMDATWYAYAGVPQKILLLSTALAKAMGEIAPQMPLRTRVEKVPPVNSPTARFIEEAVEAGMYMDCALTNGRSPGELTAYIAEQIRKLGLE